MLSKHVAWEHRRTSEKILPGASESTTAVSCLHQQLQALRTAEISIPPFFLSIEETLPSSLLIPVISAFQHLRAGRTALASDALAAEDCLFRPGESQELKPASVHDP